MYQLVAISLDDKRPEPILAPNMVTAEEIPSKGSFVKIDDLKYMIVEVYVDEAMQIALQLVTRNPEHPFLRGLTLLLINVEFKGGKSMQMPMPISRYIYGAQVPTNGGKSFFTMRDVVEEVPASAVLALALQHDLAEVSAYPSQH